MENTIENNRLIAEFMGLEKCSDPNHAKDPCYYISSNYRTAGEMKYDEKLEWLLPVIERINGMCFDNIGEVGCVIYPDRTDIIASDDTVLIEGLSKGNLTEGVYFAVVKFINWYNSNQPPTINH